MGEIRLGTSGYCFPHWCGEVYPEGLRESDMFGFYVDQFRFNTVEINYTYYRMPSAKVFASLCRRSPPDFRFTVKLYNEITHAGWRLSRGTDAAVALCGMFMDGIKPLADSGKLGCVLAQFPPCMGRSPRSWAYIAMLREALMDVPLVAEFRNREWIARETGVRLRDMGVGMCTVDEPQTGPLMPFVPAVTSDIAYLRLHGRNPGWFSDPAHRYDYLYSCDQLSAMLPSISRMAESSKCMYIALNNCHAGSAVQNVRMLADLLGIDLPYLRLSLFDD